MNKPRKLLDQLVSQTKKPVAIFDLDGTVFDVVYRSMEILKRFVAQPDIRARFAEEAALVAKIRHEDFVYSIDGTLTAVGITNESESSAQFLHAAETFWFKHFFTDELLAFDVPYAGAAECVNLLHKKGVQIVYLSGRDVPNMSHGTIEALEKHGFPHTGHGVMMCLKPAYGQNDLLFKKQALENINSLGTVVCTFDNEPANVEMFLEQFPHAMNVLFESHHARWIDLEGEHFFKIKGFDELGF